MTFEKNKIPFGTLLTGLFVAVLFILFSHLGAIWANSLNDSLMSGTEGMIGYVGITVLAIIIAPVSTIPLLPIATYMWGPLTTALLSILGWTIGAQIAFWLARLFGKKFIHKISSMQRLKQIEQKLPQSHVFWSLVFLRIGLPVDILSYALGLFTHVHGRTYFFATLLGVTPFAFIFSYAGMFPWYAQGTAVLLGISIFFYTTHSLERWK
jgi:uncharacterized membrane protein YdjX (TVP38/TMEM64 family)